MDWEKFWNYFGQGVAIFAFVILGYMLVRAIDTSGEADYCYIRSHKVANEVDGKKIELTTFTLKQHVPWGDDRIVVIEAHTFEEVTKAAESIRCPIK